MSALGEAGDGESVTEETVLLEVIGLASTTVITGLKGENIHVHTYIMLYIYSIYVVDIRYCIITIICE